MDEFGNSGAAAGDGKILVKPARGAYLKTGYGSLEEDPGKGGNLGYDVERESESGYGAYRKRIGYRRLFEAVGPVTDRLPGSIMVLQNNDQLLEKYEIDIVTASPDISGRR